MTQLRYDETELMGSHAWVRPQVEGGRRLHGGWAQTDAADSIIAVGLVFMLCTRILI